MNSRATLALLLATACESTLVTGSDPLPQRPLPEPQFDAGGPPDADRSDRSPPREAGSGALTQILHDMEDGNINFPSAAVGVLGSWFAAINYAAGRAPLPLDRLIEAIVPPRGASQKACHLRAGRYEDGVDLFVDFHPISGRPDFNHADLRAFAGIAFWARSATSDRLIVAVADDGVNVQDEFWKAELDGNAWPARQLTLTDRWERYVLLFEDFRAGITVPAAGRTLNAAAINSFHFLAGVGGSAVDFWIDDIAMLCRGPC